MIAISDRDSFLMARRVTQEEGLLIGGSCGTAVAAALELAAEGTPDDLIVVLLPDSGRGYLSRVYNDDWMAGFGFLRSEGSVVADVIAARDGQLPPLAYVQPQDSVRQAVNLMRSHGLSQLPVAKGEMPLAAAEVMGSVDELQLMEKAFRSSSILDVTVEEVMGAKLPTVGIGQTIDHAVALLDRAPALLVLDGGRPCTVVARTDVLSFLSDVSTAKKG